ncbi:MAG: protein kinase [Gemmataceae bacterium]|nr:protein kinase [Gemmataceae bacterium]
MTETNCPLEDSIRLALRGQAGAEEVAAIQAHLSGCAACRDTAQRLRAEADAPTLLPSDAATKTEPLLAPVLKDRHAALLAPAQAAGEMGRLGPYRVLKVLGAGGMGVVYQAEDPRLARTVALKAMLPEIAARPEAKERFLREARAIARLEHDHVVAIYAVDEDRGVPFIAMPFLKGRSLEARLREAPGQPLPLPEAVRIGREIAAGLVAAHALGLVHRDIKPDNIWLDRAAGDRAKILDFGLARSTSGDQNLTQANAILGTPAYMAPEQTRGGNVDSRADLFSLGVVLYRLCTGSLPFQRSDAMSTLVAIATEEPAPLKAANPHLPPGLAALIMHLLEKDPARRVGSADEAVRRLRAIEEAKAPQASKGRGLLLAAVVGVLALLGIGAWLALSPKPNPKPKLDRGPAVEEWEPLFNGKDLTGWKTHPDQPGEWAVQGGILIGKSPPMSHLLSERDDLADFRLKVEARINAEGNSGVVFRAPYRIGGRYPNVPPGFEAQILGLTFPGPGQALTGSLFSTLAGGDVRFPEPIVKPGEWFMMEVETKGEKVTVRVNGRTTAEARAFPSSPPTGHLALQTMGAGTVAEFRRIEIRIDRTEKPSRPDGRSPFDSLERRAIPPANLALAGGGDPKKAAPEIVAVLGPEVRTFAVSPDGRTVAVAYGSGRVALWDAATRKETSFNDIAAERLLFSPNGKLLAISQQSGAAVWDVAAKEQVKELTRSKGPHAFAFSADGKGIWFGSPADALAATALVEGWKAPPLEGGAVRPAMLATSTEGSVLAAGVGDRLKAWDAATGKGLLNEQTQEKKPVKQLVLAPRGRNLAYIEENNEGKAGLVFVGGAKGPRALTGLVNERVAALAFHPDGITLAWINQRGSVRLWNMRTQKALRRFLVNWQGGGKEIEWEARFASDGRHVLVRHPSGLLLVARLESAGK